MEQTRLVTRPHSILSPPHYFFIELFILHSGMTGRYLETSHSLNTQAQATQAGAAGVEFTSKCKQNFMRVKQVQCFASQPMRRKYIHTGSHGNSILA